MAPETQEMITNLLNGLRERLRSRWQESRRQSFNQNTKGAAYENALATFLDEYFGGAYDIRTRTGVIDNELKCFEVFTPAQNEIDVVAVFPQSCPQLVFESEGMAWVPYRGVAFVCEVKSSLTTTALRDDLDKTGKLQQIERTEGFGVEIGGSTTVNHQLKCLIYDEIGSIADETLIEILEDNPNAWDLILLVEEDEIIANPHLPLTETLNNPLYFNAVSEDGLVVAPNGLLWFLVFIGASVPHPPTITTVNPLLQMVHRESILENLPEVVESVEVLEEDNQEK